MKCQRCCKGVLSIPKELAQRCNKEYRAFMKIYKYQTTHATLKTEKFLETGINQFKPNQFKSNYTSIEYNRLLKQKHRETYYPRLARLLFNLLQGWFKK